VIQNLLVALLVVWSTALTVAFYWKVLHNKKTHISDSLDSGDVKALVDDLSRRLSLEEDRGKLAVQKIGFVRFNPFKETGGAQSFVIALLDRLDNGFILTSLHSRGGTRTYAKLIQQGKSDVDLSLEEKKALQIAQNENK
jgi:hypothetical protein